MYKKINHQKYSQSGNFLKELLEEIFEYIYTIKLFSTKFISPEMTIRSSFLKYRFSQI